MADFELEFPLLKAEALPEAPEQWRFIGHACSGRLDRQKERITEKAVSSMKQQIRDIPVCAAGTHEEATFSVLSELGHIDGTDDEDPTALVIKGYWDQRNPAAAFIHGRLSDPNPPDWKLSLGGKVSPQDTRLEFEGAEPVRYIDNLRPDHIFLCRGGSAVDQGTEIRAVKADVPWTDVIFKAAAIPDEPEVNDGALVEDCASIEKAAFSAKPWESVDQDALPASCHLYVGDPEKKTTWKFPVYDGGGIKGEDGMYSARGSLNINAIAAAAGRLSATTPEVRAVVAPKLKRLYAEANKDLPPSLKGKAEEDPSMANPKEILEKVRQLLSGGEESDPVEKTEPVDVVPVADSVVPDSTPEYLSKADAAALVDERLGAVKTEILEAIEKAMAPVEGAEDPVLVMKADMDEKLTAMKADIDSGMATMKADVQVSIDRFGAAAAMIEKALGTEGASAQPEPPEDSVSKATLDASGKKPFSLFAGHEDRLEREFGDWIRNSE